MQLYKKRALRSRLRVADVLLGTPRVAPADWVALPLLVRWLVMVRAVVLIMTASAVLVGVLPAMAQGRFHAGRFVVLLVGLVCAHATNNLINDYVDSRRGLDSRNYLRRRYGVHALEEGLVTPAQFGLVVAVTGAIALLCGLWLAMLLGAAVFCLVLSGAFFVIFYSWPLKHFALGELSVLLVWGPLMTAGSYFVMTGRVTPENLVLAVVYGIGPTLVILGKHMDKAEQDRERGVHSLPVILGRVGALRVCLALLTAQWLLTIWLLATGGLPLPGLLLLLGLPAAAALVRCLRSPRPDERPAGYAEAVWPLWYAAFAFRYSRDFGGLLVLALTLALLI